ncbi:dynein light chain 1, cytoplasmic-like [Rattus rattus]|uniref:dynein light chain 1, cytoplasmic-like n=1 Tax=Rattus rattus TaxID=10117 RepID=UPI0013F37E3C|nr:dynein light chain 1, cytoplasmic-like [Rattus rattus]
MCDRKAVIKNADMSEEIQQDSAECATQALEKYDVENRNFGSYVTHETKHSIYFYLGQVATLPFKSG